jgi:hypothetical protein
LISAWIRGAGRLTTGREVGEVIEGDEEEDEEEEEEEVVSVKVTTLLGDKGCNDVKRVELGSNEVEEELTNAGIDAMSAAVMDLPSMHFCRTGDFLTIEAFLAVTSAKSTS